MVIPLPGIADGNRRHTGLKESTHALASSLRRALNIGMRYSALCLGLTVYGLVVSAAEVKTAPVPTVAELKRFAAEEAVQGVAVDAEYAYVIADHAIGKYRKADGQKVANWTAPKGSGIKHLNAGTVLKGKLYCAHSNFPAKPDESSIEIFDVATLQPVGRQVFNCPPGSLTWALPYQGGWLTCFAHYAPLSDNGLSRIVNYDAAWQELRRWNFPPALLQRFGLSSSSGASLLAGERLIVSGHDAKELYALALPPAGGELRWEATWPFLSAGQAFDTDPSEPQAGPDFVLYSIQRKTKEVVVGRYQFPPR